MAGASQSTAPNRFLWCLDIAEIVYSIQTQGSDAQTCQEENSAASDQVVALLKQLGVAENSIRTTGYYLNPVYDWSGSMQVLTGYEAVTTLTIPIFRWIRWERS